MSAVIAPVSVKALCQPAPKGQQLIGAVIEYDGMVKAEDVKADQFEAEGHVITGICVSDQPDQADNASEGRFVMISFEPENLIRFDPPGRDAKMVRDEPDVKICQIADICEDCPKWDKPVESEGSFDPIADKFVQKEFTSVRTEKSISYNLFLPEGYDDGKLYPLVLFIHDAGSCSEVTKIALWQGMGGTIWAEPDFQEKHPCIVLAPEYPEVVDHSGGLDMVEATFDLVESIMAEYPVDPKRVYGTGQSLGTITEIDMSIRRPDFFTAMLLIAGQNDAESMAVMKDCKMMIIVSRGDPRAYSGMNDALAVIEKAGGKVERAEWDQDDRIVPEEEVEELKARKCPISYAVLKTEERGFQCHMATWEVAYTIKGTKEWLFDQVKD